MTAAVCWFLLGAVIGLLAGAFGCALAAGCTYEDGYGDGYRIGFAAGYRLGVDRAEPPEDMGHLLIARPGDPRGGH